MERFHISIYSDFAEFWRYNIAVMSFVSHDGEQVELLKCRDDVAPVGSSLVSPPMGYNPNRKIELHHAPADNLTLYIYILPHTFPWSVDIEETPPFELRVEVKYGDTLRYAHSFEVEQWSGGDIVVEL